MATAVSQHVHHLGRHLGFFKNFTFSKTAANFLEFSRKHVFTASNRNILVIKNTVNTGHSNGITHKRLKSRTIEHFYSQTGVGSQNLV